MDKKTATRKMTYGVSTTERSKDGFHVNIVDSRLNIGAGFDPGRRACTVIELREAADKLNAHDDLVKALQAFVDTAGIMDRETGETREQEDSQLFADARAALAKAGAA